MPRIVSPRKTLSPPPLRVPLPDVVGIKDPAVANVLQAVINQLNAVSNYVRQQTTTPSLPPPTGPTQPNVAANAGSSHVVEFLADVSGPKIESYRIFRADAGTRLAPTDPGPDTAVCIGTVTPSKVEDGYKHRFIEREFTVTQMDPANPARFKYWVTSVDDRGIESAFVEATGNPIETLLNGPGDQSPEIKFIPLNKLANPHFENRRITTANVAVATSVSISSSTNATPIEITTGSNHGLTVGDLVCVDRHTVNTNANGWWVVDTIPSVTRFTLQGSVGNGVGGATGNVYPSGLAPMPPNPGLDPDLPISTGPNDVIYTPWMSSSSGGGAAAEFVSNGSRRTNEIILKAPATGIASVTQTVGARTANFGMHLTFSVYAKRSSTVPTNSSFGLEVASLGGSWGGAIFVVPIATELTTTYRRFLFNFVLPSTSAEVGSVLSFRVFNQRVSGTSTDVTIMRAMLNVGDQAGEWTPMPDYGDYLSDSGNDVTSPSFGRAVASYIQRNGVTYA